MDKQEIKRRRMLKYKKQRNPLYQPKPDTKARGAAHGGCILFAVIVVLAILFEVAR